MKVEDTETSRERGRGGLVGGKAARGLEGAKQGGKKRETLQINLALPSEIGGRE